METVKLFYYYDAILEWLTLTVWWYYHQYLRDNAGKLIYMKEWYSCFDDINVSGDSQDHTHAYTLLL